MSLDVVDRLNTERALREALLELNAIVENASVGIAMTRERVYVRCSPRFNEILGYAAGELEGMPGEIIYPSLEIYEELGSRIGPILAGGNRLDVEMQLKRKDGTLVWAQIRAKAVDHADTSKGTIWIVDDITERKLTKDLLHAEKERAQETLLELNAILQNASVGIALTRHRTIIQCSPRFNEILGYAPGELQGQPGATIYPSLESYAELGSRIGPILAAGELLDIEMQLRRKDGTLLWTQMRGKAIDQQDNGKGTIWIVDDIAERKLAADLLYAEKERAQVTLHSIGDAVLTTDAKGRIAYLNPVAESLTGWSRQDAQGLAAEKVFDAVDETTRQPIENIVVRVLKQGSPSSLAVDTVLLGRDRREHAVEYSAAPLRDREGVLIGTVLVFRDVTAQRSMARAMSWEATHDALTNLVNRREFQIRLDELIASTRRLKTTHILMLLDLDQFKIVNDTGGHAAGDGLLRALTSELVSALRANDTLARLGGDEFGILLEKCDIEHGAQVAEKLRQLVENFRFTWKDKTFKIGVSIGVVAIDEFSVSASEAMGIADGACYLAKDLGRNCVQVQRFGDKKLTHRRGEMEWVARIHKALEEDRFRLYSQSIIPVHSPATNDHFEILLRMIDEEGKIVPPMAFLPAAQRYDLMPMIDRWVIKEALAYCAARYGSTGKTQLDTIAINISAAALMDTRFADYVHEHIIKSKLPAQRVCFEITETAAIMNLATAVTFMENLKAIGCRFALDDFGSGMSSFTYLKNLPVDYLKIDGSFVRDMLTDPIDCAMVEAINKIGHTMGLKTIAEFVENEAILGKLSEIGVDYAQGYGIAKPKPLDAIAAEIAVIKNSSPGA
jgi:diguanylate cyclase (GGDEF)-like protein/PAS domain S-box-containing protein